MKSSERKSAHISLPNYNRMLIFGKRTFFVMPLPNISSVVQKVDSTIYRINHYSVDNTKDFVKTHPLDSDLSSG